MKKSTMLIGNLTIFVFLVGAFLSAQHLQMASILMAFACLVFSFGYAIPFYFEKVKGMNDKHSKQISFWVMLLMVLFPIVFMFMVLHLPFANELVYGGLGVLGFSVPFFIYHGFKMKESADMLGFQNIMIAALFLASCCIVVFPINGMKYDEYISNNHHELTEMKFQSDKSTELVAIIINSPSGTTYGDELIKNAKDVKCHSDSLCNFIISLEKLMVESTGQKNWIIDSIEMIDHKESRHVPMEFLVDVDGRLNGDELKMKINKYKSMISTLTSVRGKEVISLFLNTENVKYNVNGQKKLETWQSRKFGNHSLIAAITELNQLRSIIRLLEAETMLYLQAKTAKENYENKPCNTSCDYLYGCFM